MKLYNPFKLHIVQFADGTYAVRKLIHRGLIGFCWLFLDTNAKSWEGHVYSYCKHKCYEDAFTSLAKRSLLDDEDTRSAKRWANSRKVTKVIA
jgi:hypothetical protein